jgi:hypothetical protein
MSRCTSSRVREIIRLDEGLEEEVDEEGKGKGEGEGEGEKEK